MVVCKKTNDSRCRRSARSACCELSDRLSEGLKIDHLGGFYRKTVCLGFPSENGKLRESFGAVCRNQHGIFNLHTTDSRVGQNRFEHNDHLLL